MKKNNYPTMHVYNIILLFTLISTRKNYVIRQVLTRDQKKNGYIYEWKSQAPNPNLPGPKGVFSKTQRYESINQIKKIHLPE